MRLALLNCPWLLVLLGVGVMSIRSAAAQGVQAPLVKGPGGIVAIVGDEVITRAELDKKLDAQRAALLAKNPPSVVDREMPWIERDALDLMIDTKILLQLVRQEEKKGQGPYIVEPELDAEVNRQVEAAQKAGERLRGPEDLYRRALEREGISREEYRKHLKEELSITKYLWQRVYKIYDDFVPPQELKAYYELNTEEFQTPVEVAFRYLAIKYSRDDRLDTLMKLVKDGLETQRDFGELAKQVAELQGEDPDKAGNLNRKSFEELKEWVRPTADVLRSLKKGETSPPVRCINDTIRMYKVEDTVQGEARPFEEVQEEISRRLRARNHRQLYQSFLEQQRRKTRVQIYLPPLPKPEADPLNKNKDAASEAATSSTEKPPAEK